MVFALPTWVSVIIIIGFILYLTRWIWPIIGYLILSIFMIVERIVALPFILIRDFIYRVILNKPVNSLRTFTQPRTPEERRMKAKLLREREEKRERKERQRKLKMEELQRKAREEKARNARWFGHHK